MLRRVVLVRTDVSEDRSASIIRVTRIGQLETMLPHSMRRLLVLLTLFLAQRFLSPCCWWRYVPPKRRLLQEPQGVTSQKAEIFIVTAVETSNLTCAPLFIYVRISCINKILCDEKSLYEKIFCL
jgi:hypothetical protein